MTQEEKQLLLVDLCARLPYGVMVYHPDYLEPQTLDTVFNFDAWQDGGIQCNVDDVGDRPSDMIYCKPYLRPLSSMTEEEKKSLPFPWVYKFGEITSYDESEGFIEMTHDDCSRLTNWLNKKMFDYRGLIPKGIAISTVEFNPYKD